MPDSDSPAEHHPDRHTEPDAPPPSEAPDSREAALLERLRAKYLQGATAKVGELALLICQLLLDAEAGQTLLLQGESPLALAARCAHSLAGSGGSYGFPGITRRARCVERSLERVPEDASPAALLLDALTETLALRSDLRHTEEGHSPLL